MQLELWQILVLAVVQGITEFLPISSDGHLVVVAAALAPGGDPESLDVPDLIIVLHAGTLVSIIVFYWRRIWELLLADRRTLGLLFAATIPAVVIGLPTKLYAESVLGDPVVAGFFLMITGAVLLAAKTSDPGSRHHGQLTVREAFFVGLAQAAAILPGLSRSGCTIATGLRMKLAPTSAATFSFLMAIPVIAGACVVQFASIWKKGGLSMPVSHLLLGVVVSFLVGLAALWWLVRWLERGRFAFFAWWCIPLGAVVLIWQLAQRFA